mmetsp:Transcript_3043/g.4659  ORF Transcript_3043/g.4659 Transcript_3043/m.4659 type:complete len:101 (+) Transcript_3043:163-465(+)
MKRQKRKRAYHEEEEEETHDGKQPRRVRTEHKPPNTETKKICNATKSNIKILELLSIVCKDAFQAKNFDERLKNIKQSFFERNYEDVFSKPENLCLYAAQ